MTRPLWLGGDASDGRPLRRRSRSACIEMERNGMSGQRCRPSAHRPSCCITRAIATSGRTMVNTWPRTSATRSTSSCTGDDSLFFAGDQDAVLGEIEAFLTGTRSAPEHDRVLATVLFTDVVSSTERATEIGDARWHDLLDTHDRMAADEVSRFRGRIIKSTGDGILATFDGPARAIRCAASIGEAVRSLGLEIRAGLHAGEVELRGDDIGGIAVHTAARVMGQAGAGEILVSNTVKDLVVGSGIEFLDRGEHELRGLEGRRQLFAHLP